MGTEQEQKQKTEKKTTSFEHEIVDLTSKIPNVKDTLNAIDVALTQDAKVKAEAFDEQDERARRRSNCCFCCLE